MERPRANLGSALDGHLDASVPTIAEIYEALEKLFTAVFWLSDKRQPLRGVHRANQDAVAPQNGRPRVHRGPGGRL